MFKRWFKRKDGKQTVFSKVVNTIRDIASFTPIGGTVNSVISVLEKHSK